MILFREKEYVDQVLAFKGTTWENHIIDPDAPIAREQPILVGLEGGSHDGETTVSIIDAELILEDGEIYA